MDKDLLKDHARGNWHNVMAAIGIPEDHLTKVHGPCPLCGGKDRFRFYDDWIQTGGSICSTCNPGGSADGFATIQWFLSIDFPSAMQQVADVLGVKGKRKRKSKPKPAEEKPPEEQLQFTEWNKSLEQMFRSHNPGITRDGLDLAGARMATYQGKAVIAIPCYGQDMETVVGWVVMNCISKYLTTFAKDGSVEKQVRHKQVAGSKSGLIGDVTQIATTTAILKTEGLTDALAAMSIEGLPLVLTNSSGSGEQPKWMADVLSTCPEVWVLHDADDPGERGATRWCAHIAAANESCTVKHVRLPYEISQTKGKDLRDYIAESPGDAAERICKLAGGESRITAGEIPVERGDEYQHVLDDLLIDVIGETESGEILVYSRETQKTSTLRLRGLSQNEMIQVAGVPASELIGDEGHSMRVVSAALAMAASYRRIDPSQRPRGIGVYSAGEHVVLSNGRHLSVFNGKFDRVDTPRCDDLIFEFGGRDWYDHEDLSEGIRQAADREWCQESIGMLVEMIGRWTWSHQDIDPAILTGLVMATFTQSCWLWRPSVSIRGASGTGKTFFAKFLFGDRVERAGVFGKLAHYVSQSTAAGIRQSVGDSSVAVCLDEWDSTPLKARRDVLGLLRTSGGGDAQVFGSSHHKAVEFGLRHIVWIQGICVGMDENADANRFLTFDMIQPSADRYKAWRNPTIEERTDVFRRLLPVAIVHCREAAGLSLELQRRWSNQGIENRLVTNLSVPVAMLSVAGGQDPDETFDRCRRAVQEESDELEPEEERLLKQILSLPVRGPAGTEFTVDYVLHSRSVSAAELIPQCLQQTGVEFYEYNGQSYLAIQSTKVASKVELEAKSITQILKRFPGALSVKRRSDIGTLRFLLIPSATVEQSGTPSGTKF